MKTAKFALPATLAQVTDINVTNIKVALADFDKHTTAHCILEDITDAFITRLAEDSAVAKSGLRDLFRRVKGWDENLQAIVLNGTTTHDPDWETASRLVERIVYNRKIELAKKVDETENPDDYNNYNNFCRAVSYFKYPESERSHLWIEALNKIAPKVRVDSNRPINKIFRDFCKAIGVYDGKASSENHELYVQYSDEVKSKQIDFKLFVSINPAHFMTMSNPIDDLRNPPDDNHPGHRKSMLCSCHSLNRTDMTYNIGNAGYARDDVTFIVFTVSNPDKAELLNNRKTTRQLFMYKPYNGLLLQSRMYTSSGGTCGEAKQAPLYRDLVQRVICEAEGSVNLWKTSDYDISGVDLYEGEGFQGYRDWLEFSGATIKLSIRKDKADNFKTFTIGTYGLCVKCGDELYNKDSHNCEDCDPRERCYHCEEWFDEDEVTWVINRHGDSVPVCGDCLTNNYLFCSRCEQWHDSDDCTELANGEYVCEDCLEYCHCCDLCERWFDTDGDLYLAYDGGEERLVCEDCLNAYFTECPACGEYHRDEDIDRESGLCRQCHEEQEEENE